MHHDHPVAEIVRKNAAVIEQGLGLEAGALTVEPLHIANELINHVIKRLRAKDLISLPLLPETPSKRRWPSTRTLVLPPPLERAQFDANVVNLRVAGALPRELCKVFLDARMVQF